MPDNRLAKTRHSLPVGYRFGDAEKMLDDGAMLRLFYRRYVAPAMEALNARAKNGHTDADDLVMLRYLGRNTTEVEPDNRVPAFGVYSGQGDEA